MIIYFDLRKTPLFRSVFRKSGVIQKSHYRGFIPYYAMLDRRLRRLPSGFFYARPEFCGGDDKIIVFDSYTNPRHLAWLCEKEPEKRVILWYWNVIGNADKLREIPERVEVWSYSRKDCLTYGLKHNTQFFFDCFSEDAEKSREKSREKKPSCPPEVLFIGRDKGRAGVLKKLQEKIEAAGGHVRLMIMPPEKGTFSLLKEKLIPYEKNIEYVKKADIILDYVKDGASGLSLRCMESLFFGKKLITNNKEILTADFYDPANIYVLGQDKRTLEEFFRCETAPADPKIRDRYLLSNWLKRFDEGGEVK